MNYLKIFFLALVLAAILMLALKMNSPVFVMIVFFLPASFLASLSAGAQSFTLARLPFLFSGGAVFFLLLFRDNLSDGALAALGASAFFLVLLTTNYFAILYKALPNIAGEEYEKFALKYETGRSFALVFLFLAAFIWYADAFVIYSFFGYPFYSVLLVIFSVTFLLSSFALRVYAALRKENKNSQLPAIYSWVIGLIIVQVSWVIGFWPFGYLTAAFIITIIYYIIVVLFGEYFFGRKNALSAVKEFLFALAIIAIIFYFTRWFPV